MSPRHPSKLVQEMRAAILASSLSARQIRRLTLPFGGVSHTTIERIKSDDGWHGNSGTIAPLALGLSRSPHVCKYWERCHRPIGIECVAYWTSLHQEADSSHSRRKQTESEEDASPACLSHSLTPLAAYCEL